MSAINSFSSDAISMFTDLLPLALGVLVSIVVVFSSIKWFMSLSGLGALTWEIWRYDVKSHFGNSFQRGVSSKTASDLRHIRGY